TTPPHKLAEEQGERFIEYLKRAMLLAAALATPQDVAWYLASYARDAKDRIEKAQLPALDNIRSALEEALGLKFEGTKGEHFFRSTLVQTLFYGIFSAWVLWSKEHPPTNKAARFDWRSAAWSLHVPMIRALFEQVAVPSKLGPLKLVEVLDWTAAALNRIDRVAFFSKFEEAQAVQYFYEPFLEAFDPELRKELGVWYTPPEIVKYMVERVDTVLREELGLESGLADPKVYVLDPCTGTGSFVVEVLRKIDRNLKEQGIGDALGGDDLKQAAINRVFGFEILPAPFVIAHLQIGLLLQNLGAPLSNDNNERAGVYLTNALTGWEPPKGPKQLLMFPELQEERDAAGKIKREVPILVVIGNPPYNGYAGVSPKEEDGLVEPYKQGLISEWGIKKFNLDDLYIRFFRLAERRIAEKTGKGIVCYISNSSYLGDKSFVVMRQRLLREFDKLWFDSLNGDSRETGKLTPEGKPDPSIFSTQYNREGIRLGTAVSLLVCKQEVSRQSGILQDKQEGHLSLVRFRQFWGENKRAELLESLRVTDFDNQYQITTPEEFCFYSFPPLNVNDEYKKWAKLTDLCQIYPHNGPIERRGNSLIVFEPDKARLELLKAYLDSSIPDDKIRTQAPRFMKSSGEFKAERTRAMLKGKVQYNTAKIVRYPFKPFDIRLAYLDHQIQPLFSRPSPELLTLASLSQNAFLITRDSADKDPEGSPFFFSRIICDYDCLSGHARHFPFRVISEKKGKAKKDGEQNKLFVDTTLEEVAPIANLSPDTRSYLKALEIHNPDTDLETVGLIWMHSLAIGYSPVYLTENTEGIRYDWPRIPLPNSKGALFTSVALGRQVAALLDTETLVKGVTTGVIRPELRNLAVISRVGGGALNLNEGELEVKAGWGHAGKEGVTMPGKGKRLERDYTAEEKTAIEQGAATLGLSGEDAFVRLGEKTCDLYLNDVAYWRNVPINVWDYYIGGYQVIKKWLSYREQELLGRSLTVDEAREVMNMTCRIAAIRLL
ncbi:MAG: type ISP restriction/modification enzyme, partial [Chloroflexota bacterium]